MRLAIYLNESIKQILLSTGFCLALLSLQAQDYSPKIVDTQLKIGETSIPGYRTMVAFDLKAVKKGFWKYCQDFARLDNLKTHYLIEIPAELNEGNTDVFLYAVLEASGEQTVLKMAVKSEDLPKDQIDNYNKQAKSLILEFKRAYYHAYYQDQIDDLLNQARRLGKDYEKYRGKSSGKADANIALGKLKEVEAEIERLRKVQLSI